MIGGVGVSVNGCTGGGKVGCSIMEGLGMDDMGVMGCVDGGWKGIDDVVVCVRGRGWCGVRVVIEVGGWLVEGGDG